MPDVRARSLMSLTRRLTARHEGDAALLARYSSANDPAAFAELVRRHGPMVLGVCRRMLGHVHDADDAFQAAFLVLARKARSVRKPEALSAWLCGTAVRMCRKALRKRGTLKPLPTGTAAGDDPFAEVAWREVRGLLDDEVGRLPDSLRDPLLLCYFNGMTRDEAAEKLGWSRRTLMRRLEEARERLRRRLERRGVATVGLGAAVLSPQGLATEVPGQLAAAAVGVGTGGPVPAGVQALANETAVKLLHVAAGLTLLLAGGGIGLATFKPVDSPLATEAKEEGEARTPPPSSRKADRENARLLDTDGQPLPAGAAHRLGSRRYRIEGRNDFLLPTPDGQHVLVHPQPSLSAYAAQGLMLLDADTGLRVRSFEDSRRVAKCQTYQAIRPAAFSPDGKKLYALGWHKSEEGEKFADVWASFDNPGKRVLLVWDVATGKLTAEWDLPAGTGAALPGGLSSSLLSVTASSDGKRLYVYGAIRMEAGPGFRGMPGVHVLDAATGKHIQTWDGAGLPIAKSAASKELITLRQGAEIAALDAESGKPVRSFPIIGFVPSAALSPDGKVVAAVIVPARKDDAMAFEIKLWEADTAKEVRSLKSGPKTIRYSSARLVFAADGKTLYLAGISDILRWDVKDGRELPGWSAHNGRIADLCLRPGRNELISTGMSDGAVRRWDPATGKALSTTDAYVGRLAVAPSPSGKEVAVADVTGRVDVWDVSTGRVARSLRLPADRDRSMTFSPDGRWLLDGTSDGKISVRDAKTGQAHREILAAGPGGWWMAFSPDGRRLFTTRQNEARLLTWPDGFVVWQGSETCLAAFSPDGTRIVSGNWNEKTILRDAKTGVALSELPGESLASAAYSPDGRRLATGHIYGPWRVRDGITGAVLKTVQEYQHVFCVAFSPSGWLLAVAGDKVVRVYDTASWQQVARFDGHDGTVDTVCFGPDDRTLVSASSEDGTALVWSLKPLATREPPEPARLWADLAGDGPAVGRAVCTAAQHPDVAVKLFRQKWPVPEKLVDAERVRKLIDGLDSAAFAEREAAQAELVKLGRQTEAELRKAFAGPVSAEVKRRTQSIVDQWAPPATAEYPAEAARELRAVWALELAGTAEAKMLLEAWVAAKVGNRLCEEAAAALKRLQGSRR